MQHTGLAVMPQKVRLRALPWRLLRFDCSAVTHIDMNMVWGKGGGLINAWLSAFLSKCNVIEHIGLAFCKCLTDVGLQTITRLCRQLTSLVIQDCALVSEKGVRMASLQQGRGNFRVQRASYTINSGRLRGKTVAEAYANDARYVKRFLCDPRTFLPSPHLHEALYAAGYVTNVPPPINVGDGFKFSAAAYRDLRKALFPHDLTHTLQIGHDVREPAEVKLKQRMLKRRRRANAPGPFQLHHCSLCDITDRNHATHEPPEVSLITLARFTPAELAPLVSGFQL